MNNLPIRIRVATEDDVPFIFNSWLKSYRSSFFAKSIPNTIYFNEHHKLLETLMKANEVLVACNIDDPTQLYGYICAGTSEDIFTLHYIYVKHQFRSMGIGKSLLNSFSHDPSKAAIYTHSTKVADRLAMKYNLVYHPYTAFKQLEQNNEEREDS